MEALQKLIREAINKMDLKMSDKEKAKYADMMIEIFDKGRSPHQVLGISEEMIEYMYNYGYRLYNNGNYKRSKEVFLGLIQLMPKEPRFTLAVAASCHRLKEYDQAVNYYFQYGMQEEENPVPFYYLYDCYYQSGYVGDAEVCLLEVIRRSGNNPLYAKIKERSQLMLDNLRMEIERLKKEGLLEFDKEAAEAVGVTEDTPDMPSQEIKFQQEEVKLQPENVKQENVKTEKVEVKSP